MGDHSRRRRRCEAAVIDALISRFQPYYQLADYLAAYTDWMVGLAVGQPSVKEIADGQYYTDLPGGVLESMGRLFKRSVKMYVYPARDPVSGEIHTVERAQVPPPEQARKHLTEQELVNLTLVIVAINALESPEH